MNPEEDNMSTEDRVRWLRERGIQIHLPGERHDSTSAQYELRVVKIPADDRLPFEEVVLQASLGSSGDQLVELLPQEIRKTSTRISASLLDQEVLKDLSRSLKGSSIGNGDATVDRPIDIKPSTLEKQLQLGGVEAFTLCHPSPENNFTRCVKNLYRFIRSTYILSILQLGFKLLPTTKKSKIYSLFHFRLS